MSKSIVIRGITDTYVSSKEPTKNYGKITLTYVGGSWRPLIFWGNPVPKGAKVISATYNAFQAKALSGSNTVSLQLITQKWGVNTATWNNKPTSAGTVKQVTKSNTAVNTKWTWDITDRIQATVTSGVIWYGFVMTSPNATPLPFYSTEAGASKQPYVEITWSTDPVAPSQMSPSAGLAVSTPTPLLTYDYTNVADEAAVAQQHIQVSTDPTFATTAHDSGWVAATDGPQYDLTGKMTMTASTVYYWRVMTQDINGAQSPWSPVASTKYVPLGTVTVTNPAPGSPPYVEEPTPPVTWTTSFTQVGYTIQVSGDGKYYADTVSTTQQNATVKPGVILQSGHLYHLYLQVFDNVPRVANANGGVAASVDMDFQYQYNATVTPFDGMTVDPEPGLPTYKIRAHRATMPDGIALKRNGVIVATDIQPADVDTGGGWYELRDLPPGRQDVTWEMIAVVNGVSSAGNPTVTKNVRRTYSWAIARNFTNPVMFANPEHDAADSELSARIQPLDAPPFLVTQSLNGEIGTFSGVLSDELSATPARTLLSNLRSIRKNYGGKALMVFTDAVLEVYIYELKVQRLARSDGTTDYAVSFEWFEER